MRFIRFLSFLLTAGFGFGASAEDSPGMALPWQLNLQTPVTPVMQRLFELHSWLLILITGITVFVLLLLTYVCIRFNAKNHPVPSKVTHNTLVEIIWTAIPILILVVIAIPSLDLHYFMEKAQNPEMTLKVVGYQWYWGYEYPDQGGISYESRITPNPAETDPAKKFTPDQQREFLKGEPRLLTVDNPAVVPVDTTVRVLITGSDVIHSWSVPAFGVKLDAVPGRVNETWFKATQIGTFRGQCSQLCGIWHGFMPIVVKVVSKEDFAAWVAQQKQAMAPAADVESDKDAKPAAKSDKKTPAKPAAKK